MHSCTHPKGALPHAVLTQVTTILLVPTDGRQIQPPCLPPKEESFFFERTLELRFLLLLQFAFERVLNQFSALGAVMRSQKLSVPLRWCFMDCSLSLNSGGQLC